MSENTLKTHIKNLKVKTGIRSPRKLIKYAIENGFNKKDKL